MWDLITFRRARDMRYPWRLRILRLGAAVLLLFLPASYLCFGWDILLALPVFVGFYLVIAGQIDLHMLLRESSRKIRLIQDKHIAEKLERADAYMADARLCIEKARAFERESRARIHAIVAAGVLEADVQRARVRDMYLEEHEKLRASTLAAIKRIEDERRRDGEGWKLP